jgi:acetyl esterase/lipase
MKNSIQVIILLLFVQLQVYSQETSLEVDTIVYKKIDTTSLIMKVIYPPALDKSKKYPGMVFYFGGGWVGGTINHFERQANYFARRGLICFLVDYRVKSRHGTSRFECVKDAKSSVRYIRENAKQFNLDSDKIIAAGGSAGGHLAATTALVDGNDDSNDNLSISPKPNALVLFNPAVDLGDDEYKSISPLHNIKQGVPPTIIFLGTEDQFIPVVTMKEFKMAIEGVGSRCNLFLYEGQKHGFFNFGASAEHYKKTVYEADKFLISLDYLSGEPTIMDEE